MGLLNKIKEIGKMFDGAGREIHVYDGPQGEVHIKKINPMDYIPGDEQWCPNCHEEMIFKGDVWECPICFKEIDAEEVNDGYGYPTYESSFEDDYGEYYSDTDIPDDDGWH